MNNFIPPYFYTPMPQNQYMQGFNQGFYDSTLLESSYIENILRLNLGKIITVYMNFENSQWGSKLFKGVLIGAGKDHIVLKDLQSDTHFILLTIYLDYITFDEKIEYQYPYRIKKQS